MSRPSGKSRSRARRETRWEEKRQAAQRRRLLVILGSAVAIAIAVVVVLILANRPESRATPMVTAEALAAGVATNGRVMGDSAAPVTVVEWGDYQ